MEQLMQIIAESENNSNNMSRAGVFIFFHKIRKVMCNTYFLFADVQNNFEWFAYYTLLQVISIAISGRHVLKMMSAVKIRF